MSKEKKRKAFTEADFTQIRLLLDAGLSDKQVMIATGRSHFVVSNIHGTKLQGYKNGMKTFADYRKFVADHAAKYFTQKPAEEPQVQPPVVEEKKEKPSGSQVVELLKSIDRHLEDLVELKRSAIEYAKSHKRMSPGFNFRSLLK